MNKDYLTKKEIIDFLKSMKPVFEKKYGLTKIALFGSYARDEQQLTSDIDLLIEMNVHDFDIRYDLKDFLEQHFNKKVDLLYFKSIRTYIMKSIEKDLLYV